MNGIVRLVIWALAGVCVAMPGAEPVAVSKELVLIIPGPGKVQLRMKQIPAGTFVMGSPPDEKKRRADEGPMHQVVISKPFQIGVFEVTQAQWEAVMGNNPSRFRGGSYREKSTNPVEQVSWEDCQKFIEKLNGMGIGTFRLPTEAEWEYACRAGTRTAYSFGDEVGELREYAWCTHYPAYTTRQVTHQVGTRKPNPWGLYDMHGNVWEWCSDWYADYNTNKQTDPKGAASGSSRVYRGGSWYRTAEYCRSAIRSRPWPSYRSYHLGFRLVRAVQ